MMIDMNLRQIEAFRAVMISGTVQGAADLMRISQPAVSRLVRDLENATELSLFDRQRRRLRPRQEAHLLFREVEQAFAGIDRLRQTVRDIRAFGVGELRIATVTALAAGFLPQVCQSLLAANPDITLKLQTYASAIVEDELINDRCDVGVTFAPLNRPGALAEPVISTEAVCVLPPGHRLAARRLVRPVDLANERFVALASGDRTRLQIDRAFAAAGVKRAVNVEAGLATFVCALVARGYGVSIVNPFTAMDFEAYGLTLRRFAPAIDSEIFVGFPATRPRSRLVERFVTALRRAASERINELGRRLANAPVKVRRRR